MDSDADEFMVDGRDLRFLEWVLARLESGDQLDERALADVTRVLRAVISVARESPLHRMKVGKA